MLGHRVIVQLTDQDVDDELQNPPLRRTGTTEISLKKKSSVHLLWQSMRHNMGINVEVFDDSPLKINAKSNSGSNNISKNNKKQRLKNYNQMSFDRVDRGTNVGLRNELMMLFHTLLIEHQNCCIVTVQIPRECPYAILSNEILGEIDKRFTQWQFSLENIKVEYHDLRKYDVANMLTRTDNFDCGSWRRHMKPCSHFSSIQNLRRWIQSDFFATFINGSGHDFIDLQFCYYDSQRFLYKVKLSLVHIYLNRMDTETKINLRTFFENVATERKPKQCLLTSFLKDFFSDREQFHTLVIYLVPTKNVLSSIISEMLYLADATYKGAKNRELYKNSKNKKSLPTLGTTIVSPVDPEELIKKTYFIKNDQVPSKTALLSLRESKSTINTTSNALANMPTETRINSNFRYKHSNPKLKQNAPPTTTTEQRNVLNNLSVGYRRIDEKYAKVIKAMEQLYTYKYNSKITKICSDISTMMRTIDSNDNIKFNQDASDATANCPKEMQNAVHLYKKTITAFQNLYKDIQSSKYSGLLKIYLSTKNYEIKQHELLLKVRQLESCQTRLTGTIRTEVDALKKMGAVQQQMNKFDLNLEC